MAAFLSLKSALWLLCCVVLCCVGDAVGACVDVLHLCVDDGSCDVVPVFFSFLFFVVLFSVDSPCNTGVCGDNVPSHIFVT